MARPSIYEQWKENNELDYKLLLVSAWARDGLTLEQIAGNLGIHLSTLCEYQNRYRELKEALKKGKEVADVEVENALYKRATGYTRKVTKPFMHQGEIIIAEYEEEVLPDIAAAFIWLKNRKPDKWRDKVECENIFSNKERDQVSQLTTKELKILAEQLTSDEKSKE